MRVALYSPERMYGFAELNDRRVFFHIETFVAGVWPGVSEPPPPIIGEEVLVEYSEAEPATRGVDKAPRARVVERVQPPEQLSGTVESFNPQRGWGFIQGDNGIVFYLHRSEMEKGRVLFPQQRVTFYTGDRDGRPRACYVRAG